MILVADHPRKLTLKINGKIHGQSKICGDIQKLWEQEVRGSLYLVGGDCNMNGWQDGL
jgi:hypothetical protein